MSRIRLANGILKFIDVIYENTNLPMRAISYVHVDEGTRIEDPSHQDRAGRGHMSLNPISSQSLPVLFIYLFMCTSPRRRPGGGPAKRSEQHCAGRPAGDRLSTIPRALLNGLKVLSRAALFRSPGYDAELRRKRFRSPRHGVGEQTRRSSYSGMLDARRQVAMTRRAAAQNLGRRRSLSRSS